MPSSSRTLDRLTVTFDDDHAAADAGLVLPATLLKHLDAEATADAVVSRGYRPGARSSPSWPACLAIPSEAAAFWSMLSGFAVMLVLQLTGWTEQLPTTFGPPAWGFFASVALFYGISFATQPVSGQRHQQFHGYLDQTFSTAREPLPTTATPASGTSAT